MAEVAEVLDSSVQAPPIDISRGSLVNLTSEQRKEYRSTGELPKVESAPTSASVSETPIQQEKSKNEPKPKQTAEERIAQLEATIEKIKTGAGLKPKVKAEAATANIEPVSAKPKAENFKTHEEYEEAVIDWKLEKRDADKAAATKEAERLDALNEKVEKARSRHGDIDAVLEAVGNEIYQDPKISPVIKQMIGDSDVIADLIYTIGNDKAEFAKFTQMAKDNPGKAIRYIALTESLIAQELEAKQEASEIAEPAKPITKAPKPPAEAGGRAATPPDTMQAALEGSGGKLNANLKAEFLRRDLAKLRG